MTSPASYDRRHFLRTLGGASAAAAVVAAEPSSPAQAYDPGPDETRSRYRESDHVKAYYRSNGYEGRAK
jgi:hypothetical protein